MEGLKFISCIRFSIQLVMAEAFFAAGWERKKGFWLRILMGISGYFVMAGLVFRCLTSIPGNNPIIYTAYYLKFGSEIGRNPVNMRLLPICLYSVPELFQK